MNDFYVHGHAVPAEIQLALIAKMKQGPFKAAAIQAEACRLGLPEFSDSRQPVAMRAADRIIQRERKAGNIELRRPFWVWVCT
ncbi:hypothetical protein [Herbaspirillum huttiense]|uniref:hypothetical protein n=1 Tax=Herbaspirillum huttiense TaxID=863372 RepID=UPI0039AF6C64